jgi:hypothetical protein
MEGSIRHLLARYVKGQSGQRGQREEERLDNEGA